MRPEIACSFTTAARMTIRIHRSNEKGMNMTKLEVLVSLLGLLISMVIPDDMYGLVKSTTFSRIEVIVRAAALMSAS